MATLPKKCNEALQLVNSSNANYGTRIAQDTCPGCNKDFNGTQGHIDNYTDHQYCDAHSNVDLGNFWSVQTN